MKNLINVKEGLIEFSFSKTIWLYLMVLPCFLIDFSKLNLQITFIGLTVTFLTICLGHSVGLHRGVIHKSYHTSSVFRSILVYFFVLTGLGGPLSWLKLHYYRDYWQNQKTCPKYFAYEHSLLKDFWWNLHLKFIPNEIDKYGIPKEDLNNKWFIWLEKTWYLHNIIFALIIYFMLDFNSMLLLVFFRSSMTILGHWYIGYASHKYGYSHFEIHNAKESGFNDVLLGLISFGEGYHNNHHAHPTSANFSVKWYEFDLGWKTIKLLDKVGLIYDVKNHEVDNTLKEFAEKRMKVFHKFP